ncbi:MAG: hypothetical protein HFJ60_04145 [Clostridia bacterium]|jgi:hypothetical protein|nr:hypothetical protein [Clostridia bacterium]
MCKCCEEIENWKEINQNNENITSKIFAELSIRSWRKGEKKVRGNEFSNVTTNQYELRYCPLCGKKQ